MIKNCIKDLTRITPFSQFVLCVSIHSCRQGRNLRAQWWNSHSTSNIVCQWWMKLRSFLNTPAVTWLWRCRAGCLAAVPGEKQALGVCLGLGTEELGWCWGLGREQWESHRSGGFVAVPNTTGGASSGMQRWAVNCREDGVGWEKRDEAGIVWNVCCVLFALHWKNKATSCFDHWGFSFLCYVVT